MEADSSNSFMTTGTPPPITLPTVAGLYDEYNMSGGPIVAFNKTSEDTKTTSFKAAIDYVNAHPGEFYILLLDGDVSVGPLSAFNASLRLTIAGLSSNRTISLSSNGSLFTVGVNAMLVLGENITLKGLADNNRPLVKVNQSGNLYMLDDSAIKDNTNTFSGAGGGDSNIDKYGGGVNVYGGIFTMRGGKISGNKANSGGGGGVYTAGGKFEMNGGEISGNTAILGGGVFVGNIAANTGCTFTMSGGTITGNTATSTSIGGGGIFVAGTSALVLSGSATKASISGNTAPITSLAQVYRLAGASISGSDTGGEGW